MRKTMLALMALASLVANAQAQLGWTQIRGYKRQEPEGANRSGKRDMGAMNPGGAQADQKRLSLF
jgi:hypothetical protein